MHRGLQQGRYSHPPKHMASASMPSCLLPTAAGMGCQSEKPIRGVWSASHAAWRLRTALPCPGLTSHWNLSPECWASSYILPAQPPKRPWTVAPPLHSHWGGASAERHHPSLTRLTSVPHCLFPPRAQPASFIFLGMGAC